MWRIFMNIIETAVPFMEKTKKDLEDYIENLNSMLKEFRIHPVNIEPSLEKIQKQIDSANNKFTIAFVGTFKTGKSTVINSLLQLEGDKRLSSEFDPDTAKCVRIIKKERRQKYEAEVIFQDNTYPTEYLSWNEAKKYTSQVALDSSDKHINEKAKKIEEVRYYVDNPFLDLCNILDLPGTGTGSHAEHTSVTDKKIMESDCIFWVVSTDTEPDRESIKNLEKVSTKMLPIINVWQYEQEDIVGMMTPEEIKGLLSEQYQIYFADAEAPVVYYAKEIDMAQQNRQTLKEEWGKSSFVDKVTDILQNAQKGDRMTRIKKNLRNALEECDAVFEKIQQDDELQKIKSQQNTDKHEINVLKGKLSKCKNMVENDIKNEAQKTTSEILDVFINASDSFISNRMSGLNLKAVFQKERFQKELKKDFEDNYIKLKSGWIEETMKEFFDNIKNIVIGAYSSFAMDLDTEQDFADLSSDEFSVSNFVDTMAEAISKEILERFLPVMITVITGGILLLIPGGALVELAVTTLTSGVAAFGSISNDDKLIAKQDNIKMQSRNEIRQQKSVIAQNFKNIGKQLNEKCHSGLLSEIDRKMGITEKEREKLVKLSRVLENYRTEVKELIQEVKDL